MSIRQTVQIGDPKLHAENKQVTDFHDPKIQHVIADLRDTMIKEELVGMAAPQIGENYQIFVTEPRETESRPKNQSDIFRVYINPKIVQSSTKKNVIFEGCGSVSNAQIFGPVKRSQKITVEACDENGGKFQLTCDGILARVIQHELDHLNQTEFVSRVSDFKRLMTKEFYIRDHKNDHENMKASEITEKTIHSTAK